MGYRKKKKNIGIKRSGNAFERELQFKQDGQGRTQRMCKQIPKGDERQ